VLRRVQHHLGVRLAHECHLSRKWKLYFCFNFNQKLLITTT
jgi:hypothetical protein